MKIENPNKTPPNMNRFSATVPSSLPSAVDMEITIVPRLKVIAKNSTPLAMASFNHSLIGKLMPVSDPIPVRSTSAGNLGRTVAANALVAVNVLIGPDAFFSQLKAGRTDDFKVHGSVPLAGLPASLIQYTLSISLAAVGSFFSMATAQTLNLYGHLHDLKLAIPKHLGYLRSC